MPAWEGLIQRKQQATTTKPKPTTKAKYKVKTGDDWWKIARAMFGSEDYASELAKANKNIYALKKGMTINIPKPPPSAVNNASFNPRNFVQGAAIAPASASLGTAQRYAMPQAAAAAAPSMGRMATTTGLPINEDDYIPGQTPGTYIPGYGRVVTPPRTPNVGPKPTPIAGYVPPKAQSTKLPIPVPIQNVFAATTQYNRAVPQGRSFSPAFAPAFVQGAAIGPTIQPNTFYEAPQYQNYFSSQAQGISPINPYMAQDPLYADIESTMVEMLSNGQYPKSLTIGVQKGLGLSDTEMVANGYVMINGVWVYNPSRAGETEPGKGGSGGRLGSRYGGGGGGGGGTRSNAGYISGYRAGTANNQYVNPALIGLISWRI